MPNMEKAALLGGPLAYSASNYGTASVLDGLASSMPSMLTDQERAELVKLRAYRDQLARVGKIKAGELHQGDIILWADEATPRGVLAVEPGSVGLHSCPRDYYAHCDRCFMAEYEYVSLTLTAPYGGSRLMLTKKARLVEVVTPATPESAADAAERLAEIRATTDKERAELADLRVWSRWV